jgi:hypothetical protein
MTFFPTTLQTALLAARVEEFRNNVLINASTIEHVVYIISGCTVTAIEENPDDNVFIYPNPVSNSARFNMRDKVVLSVRLRDVTGKEIHTEFIQSGEEVELTDLSGLSKGIYHVEITTTEKTLRGKFAIQ